MTDTLNALKNASTPKAKTDLLSAMAVACFCYSQVLLDPSIIDEIFSVSKKNGTLKIITEGYFIHLMGGEHLIRKLIQKDDRNGTSPPSDTPGATPPSN